MQDKLSEQGSNFKAGALYLEQVAHDGLVLTGQNPWSVWKLSEDIMAALGYTPKPRVITPEENSVTLLAVYNELGYEKAKQYIQNHPVDYQAMLVLVHSVISIMNLELSQATDLLFLTEYLKTEA